MKFSREFIEINIRFAQQVEQIKCILLGDAILNFTHLYLSFGLRRDFDPTNLIWQAYSSGLQSTRDLTDWTFQFYLDRYAKILPKVANPSFGCFSYTLWADNRVRIHFHNDDPTGHSPLSQERRPQRLSELTAMFSHLKSFLSAPTTVVGGSWLYNIQAYRRLFPADFLATAQVGHDEYQFIALWGQFLDRHGQVKPDMVGIFLDRLAQQVNDEGLNDCFPYQVLRLECPIRSFYEFYGID